ncbi:MAG: alpha-2-macroglobulin family protein [Deltaproteobacteria bacterium]|nr:alpha-2-macroglobulin family protein [Deltaproteobacteria bacterium]
MRYSNLHLLSASAAVVAVAATAVSFVVWGVAFAAGYEPGDRVARAAPATTEVLPEKFLRGYDPVTVTYVGDVGPGPGPADDASSFAQLKPAWPGAWTWADKRTLQFRPAEPWPALARFAVDARSSGGGASGGAGTNKVLTTMMTAPSSMHPTSGASGLPPFHTLTLAFPQPLGIDELKQMVRLEVRDLPGLADSPRRQIDSFQLALLPRTDQKDPAVYAVSFDGDVGEGQMLVVTVALALGDAEGTLWTGRASTRTDFHLEEVVCAGQRLGITGSPKAPREQALDCGSAGEMPQLAFSAPVKDLSLTTLKKLVRLEPAVPDLKPTLFGKRVQLEGRFVPDTLYRLRIADAPVFDDLGRRLVNPGEADVYFFVGWKKPFLRLKRGAVIVEQKGPRMLPMVGYGETRADVRVHKIDPLHTGLWPFPDEPVVVDEESAPPFPGEEPSRPNRPGEVSRGDLIAHLRLMGSPLTSRLVDLPLADKGGSTNFGLDVAPLVDDAPGAPGKQRPGTYLVGVRRLTGAPERAWARVQVTNLSLTAVEERTQAVFFVRSLDGANAVDGARITIEAIEEKKGALVKSVITTDGSGKATLPPQPAWRQIVRIVVEKADDVLVLDPNSAPPRFFNNHWSPGGSWLSMLNEPAPLPKNDTTLGFLFTERPIYRPGEKVFLKGFARDKKNGLLVMPAPPAPTKETPKPGPAKLTIKVVGPGNQEWVLPTTTTSLYGGDAVFLESDPPTGWYTAQLFLSTRSAPLATRRFQIEAYKLPQFEVQLSGPNKARLDQPFNVKAMARYYAGGSVANQPIRWNVTRRPAWHVPKGREGFLFASSSQFARPEARNREEQTEKTGTLGDDGSDSIEMNPQKDIDGSPRVYRFEATVTGADDQEVSAVTEVLALPPFVLGMKLQRFAKSATSISPEVIAVGVDDKAIAGQKVELRLFKRSWHSHLRESHFATGEASYVTEQEDKKIAEKTVTTTTEPLKVDFAVDGAGVYVVELSAKDKLGRVQTLSADLYIGGKEPIAWQKGQAGVFELVPDKPKYSPGETANVVVKSPFTRARALVIIERPAANEYRVVDVEGGQATVSVEVDRAMTPNLPVHVVLMRGRLGDSKTDDSPYRPQSVGSSIDLEIVPAKNLVDVTITHPESARPGATIDVGLGLKDDKGAAIGGEVTLWLVDEAVLALAKEGPLDPLVNMIVRNQRDATVWDTRNSTVGRVIEEEAPGGDGAGDEAASGMAKRRVRKNFQTVPFYQATVVVPASGKLVVKVPLSDDLTNFVVRAVAVSGNERFGKAESKLKVRLPVLVQPQLPRFVRQGDRFEGGGVARLVEGKGGAGVVKAEYVGPVVERKRSKDITLAENKAESVTFPVEVKATATEKQLTVKMEVFRKSDGVGDAFEVKIPVYPDVEYKNVTFFDDVTGVKKTLSAPKEKARAGTMSQSVVATHIPGLLETFGALEYLDEYPHGCLEQKMSQLAPQLALAKISSRLGGFVYSEGIKGHVERLLQEMPLHQDQNGLFGYWPGSPGDVQLTAVALEFIALASESKVTVDPALRTRAAEALKQSLRSDYVWSGSYSSWRTNLQAATLRALVRVGDVDEHYLVDLVRTKKNLDASSRAELALAMLGKRKTFSSDLDGLKSDLWSAVTFNLVEGKRVFVGLNDPRRDWGGVVLGSSTSAIATVFHALVLLDPKNPDLMPLLQGLLQRAQGKRGFGSTWDNRTSVAAIIAFLEVADPAKMETKLSINDKSYTLDGAMKVARWSTTSETPPTAQATGQPVKARVRYRYLPELAGDRQPAVKEGFLVERSMTLYPAAGGVPKRSDDKRAEERQVKVGDVVEVHARFTTDTPRSNVAFTVPFAAGFEPLNPELQTSSSEAKTAESDSTTPLYVARLDHEVRYYFASIGKGTYSFHFRLKALTPGSFVHPGAHAELMYDEAVMGLSDGMRMVIERGAAE